MGKEAGRIYLYFFKKDWWIFQHAKKRAKVQNISVSQEVINALRKIYMLERRPSGKKIVIDEYLYNIMVAQKDELIKMIQAKENKES